MVPGVRQKNGSDASSTTAAGVGEKVSQQLLAGRWSVRQVAHQDCVGNGHRLHVQRLVLEGVSRQSFPHELHVCGPQLVG